MAHKGQTLEDLVDFVHGIYMRSGQLHIRHNPTSTKNIGKKIVYAKKSAVDFVGMVNGGRYIAFDAKQTIKSVLKMDMLKQHQVEDLYRVNKLGGIGFFLVMLTKLDRIFMVFPDDFWVDQYWAPRKSMSIANMIDHGYELIGWAKTIPIMNYLPAAMEWKCQFK